MQKITKKKTTIYFKRKQISTVVSTYLLTRYLTGVYLYKNYATNDNDKVVEHFSPTALNLRQSRNGFSTIDTDVGKKNVSLNLSLYRNLYQLIKWVERERRKESVWTGSNFRKNGEKLKCVMKYWHEEQLWEFFDKCNTEKL